ncbi:hypothetical protein [Maribacter polysaccharolyticus]|uniref:hypothetical protein n=1 Tax=Maribacter polysaccharolyticus TaxID=3020831 RepID=UPI00237F3269|nr:hypothetical protein [Maribacter polysaccharolyticus]MDE3741158.1 hypothetical protein [Maribacter polysaccharolyticus]
MNYIKLLNTAFEKFYFDERLNPTHISLYMALFQEWNSYRFADVFYVNRRDLMKASKIGSKSTYHRCVKDLDSWLYLSYFPSNNPYKGSKIKMSIIDSSDEPDMDRYDPVLEQLAEQHCPIREPVVGQHYPINGQAINTHRPTSGQALVSNINNIKQENHIKQPKGRQAVIRFFEENGFDRDEGKKFFTHYKTRNWQTSDGEQIRDWRALATNWMDRTDLFESKNKEQPSLNQDNLRTTKTKDYGQPL